MDVDTAVLEEEANEVPCYSVPYFYIFDGTQAVRLDAFSGTCSPASYETFRLNSMTDSTAFNTSFPLTIFLNLVITNLSELMDGPRLQEFGTALEQH
ncbi:hypothetical protein V3C99_010626 [Haemonchus contortus]